MFCIVSTAVCLLIALIKTIIISLWIFTNLKMFGHFRPGPSQNPCIFLSTLNPPDIMDRQFPVLACRHADVKAWENCLTQTFHTKVVCRPASIGECSWAGKLQPGKPCSLCTMNDKHCSLARRQCTTCVCRQHHAV